MQKRLVALICFMFMCASAHAATLIHAGNLFTAESTTLQSKVTIVVEDSKIVAIKQGFVAPSAGDTLIDLSQHTVLPGLMDMHVHLSFQQEGISGYIKRFTNNEADSALNAAYYAEKTLMAGFTTVRNLGDNANETVALRRAISRGMAVGPRIYTTAKSIATTGGHADPTNGLGNSLQGDPGPKEGVINGIAEARKAVRQRYKDGADLIKITATGGVLSVAKSGQNPQFMTDELNAIVETAKDYGMTVAVHAHGEEGMRRAVLAGADSIEHGTYMSDDIMTLMKERGTFYVPTILAGDFVGEKAKIDGYFPDIVRPKAAAIGPLIQQTFGKAYKAGVPIAFGTDSGVSAHGENAREFALMVEAGMPNAEALLSATKSAAELLNVADTLGSISVGKYADIIAVKGDPLSDIRVMESVQFVMKDGEVFVVPN